MVVKWRDEEANGDEMPDPRSFPGAWHPEAKPKGYFRLKYTVNIYRDDLWLDYDKHDLIGPMLYALFELLSKFPLSSIKKCANEPFGNFFVKTTKREKIYCSQRCAWQQTARKARKDGGEEYRKKQRKVMQKRYVEEQKKKHGPNVKVQRRKK